MNTVTVGLAAKQSKANNYDTSTDIATGIAQRHRLIAGIPVEVVVAAPEPNLVFAEESSRRRVVKAVAVIVDTAGHQNTAGERERKGRTGRGRLAERLVAGRSRPRVVGGTCV